MNLTNSQKIIVIAVIISVTAYILWPSSSDKASSSSSKKQSSSVHASAPRAPMRRFRIDSVDGAQEKPPRPYEQKHIDSTRIAPGQKTLTASSYEQYLSILERLAQLGIRPLGVSETLRSIKVILDDNTLARLKREFDELNAANDTLVWIPEDYIEPWSGRLGPSFGPHLLDWLGIDAFKEKRGKGVTVAVLDTAISKATVNPNANIKQIDLFGFSQDAAEAGHGNAVASLLVANNGALTGLAPSIELLSIPVLDADGTGSAFDVAQGIVTAVDSGADIISMSLGSYSYNSLMKIAVDYAASNGVVIVASSGNDGVNQVVYPAAFDNVIAVGAVAANSQIAGFSNSGSQVSIAAPGVGINSAWTEDSGIVSFSGTSAAVPCVVGVIANILSDNGGSLSPTEAATLVVNNAVDNGAPGQDDTYGNGVLNYVRAAESGTPGIIDAAAAGHFLDTANATETSVPLIVSAQNTGTEQLATMTLTVVVNGAEQSFTFVDVKPGETVSSIIPVSVEQIENNGTVRISSFVSTPNDNRPGNETKTSVVSISEE
ncbi:MAG: S8 family serine peptidase [Victivallales bacterium]|nr:S8 family serine peptidase [Victivallales bacterium]